MIFKGKHSTTKSFNFKWFGPWFFPTWLLLFLLTVYRFDSKTQKYSRLRCLLRVKGLVICFYLGWSGSILQFRQNIIKVGSTSWLLTCSSNLTLSLPSYTGPALKRELHFCNGYFSLLNFCLEGLYLIMKNNNLFLSYHTLWTNQSPSILFFR